MPTISFTLDSKSVGAAIKQLRRYIDGMDAKLDRLRHMIAERIRWSAMQGFSSATVSDVIIGTPPVENDVSVTMTESDNLSIVIASGSQAVFIEFGAGVYHNGGEGMIGSSPHPWVEGGIMPDYFIGMYGKGKGARRAWNIDKNTVTRGTPAAMPMYRGYMEALNALDGMIREVFG